MTREKTHPVIAIRRCAIHEKILPYARTKEDYGLRKTFLQFKAHLLCGLSEAERLSLKDIMQELANIINFWRSHR